MVTAEAEVAAALALQPLDPRDTLSAEQRHWWQELLDAVILEFGTDVGTEVEDLLRRDLARNSSLYRRTRDALRQPLGEEGQALGVTPDRFVHGDASLGSLIGGTWNESEEY